MGYRSDVAIVVKTKAVTPKLRSLFMNMQTDWDLDTDNTDLENRENYLFQHNGHYYCYLTEIKWYTFVQPHSLWNETDTDSYAYEIHTELLKLPGNAYGYTRTGEEYEDVESHGHYWNFNIEIHPAKTIIGALI
jgi:hypothetical protein